MAGKLYIVPTPVGNLEDMTFRAVQTLKDVDVILAEDTRTSSVLLKKYDIHGKLWSHHKFNEHQTVALIKERRYVLVRRKVLRSRHFLARPPVSPR